jgi:catechol 2,3-dioxygenase-like lactoylglutathione lyase family enzyme
MPIRAVSHIAIAVRDMDRALAFYRDVLGLKVRFNGIEEFPNLGKLRPQRRHGAYLSLGDGPHDSFIVLDHRDNAVDRPPLNVGDVGIHHFSFWVDDIDTIFARAQAAGTTVIIEPHDTGTENYGEPAGGTIRTTLMRDPDGNVVQLDQRIAA